MSLRLDKDNHPEVNKLFKQLNDGIPTHYQHFLLLLGIVDTYHLTMMKVHIIL